MKGIRKYGKYNSNSDGCYILFSYNIIYYRIKKILKFDNNL